MGFLGDLGRPVIADRRCQRRDEHQRAADVRPDPDHIGLEALDTELPEGATTVGQELDPVEQVMRDDRLEHVELEIALRAGDGDRRVVAEDLDADHGQHLGLRRVHLAGHDRGAGFVLGQAQLAKAGARP